MTVLTTDTNGLVDHTVPFNPTRMVVTFGVVLVLILALLKVVRPEPKSGEESPWDVESEAQADQA